MTTPHDSTQREHHLSLTRAVPRVEPLGRNLAQRARNHRTSGTIVAAAPGVPPERWRTYLPALEQHNDESSASALARDLERVREIRASYESMAHDRAARQPEARRDAWLARRLATIAEQFARAEEKCVEISGSASSLGMASDAERGVRISRSPDCSHLHRPATQLVVVDSAHRVLVRAEVAGDPELQARVAHALAEILEAIDEDNAPRLRLS